MARSRVRITTGAAVALGSALLPQAADAATFTVSNTNDTGAGSLRAAIADANATAGADTINFTTSGTIVLTTGELTITDSVTIDGPGPETLTVSANNASRVLTIDDGVDGTLRDVTLEGLTITGGETAGEGGGIVSRENLTLTGVVLTQNQAHQAGGMKHEIGSLTLTDVDVLANETTQYYAGMKVATCPSVSFFNVRVVDNVSFLGAGGGVQLEDIGTLVIEDSTISGNSAQNIAGLWIYHGSLADPAVIRRTTISGNYATISWAGGLICWDTELTVENSTISGNNAVTSGGGLYLYGSQVTLVNTTVTGNTGGNDGGNVVLYSNADLILENSIIANGVAGAEPDIISVHGGNSVVADHALIETLPTTTTVTGSDIITGVDPELGVLQNNGGLTATHKPAGTSPVVDAGDPLCDCAITDQRGLTRVAGEQVDLGSVELQPGTLSVSPATYNVAEDGGTVTVTVSRTGGSDRAVSVQYATVSGTATAGADYTAASGTLSWAAGETASKSVNVTILNDATAELSETFELVLSSPTGGAALGTMNAAITIAENDLPPFGPPANVTATATGASSVSVSWSPVSDATGYEVFRATSLTSGYTSLGTTGTTGFTDSSASANTTYLYKVRTLGTGAPSDYSAIDVATTVVMTDAILNSAIPIKAIHLTELRTAVNAMRAAAGLSAATFTDPSPTSATLIKRVHIVELRSALDEARAALGLPAISYTDPTITQNVTTAKAAHWMELRGGVG